MPQRTDTWPDLPLVAWQDTFATLHLWTQIVGKIRLVKSPWLNHSWHTTLYVTSRGLTTSPIPDGTRTFELEFDFTAHRLELRSSDGRPRRGSPSSADGRRVPQTGDGCAAASRHRGAHLAKAVGARRSDPVRGGRDASLVRRRVRESILAGARPGRPCVQDFSDALHRQGEPGSLLLGRGRSGGHALLGTHGPPSIPAAFRIFRTG